MSREVWYCMRCQEVGVVDYLPHVGRREVMFLVADSHYKISPECSAVISTSELRILRGPLTNLPYWLRGKVQKFLAATPGSSP